jgi:hypothetical protein
LVVVAVLRRYCRRLFFLLDVTHSVLEIELPNMNESVNQEGEDHPVERIRFTEQGESMTIVLKATCICKVKPF